MEKLKKNSTLIFVISSANVIRKIKKRTIFEENMKDQVSVNQLLCVECEKSIAELKAEKNTVQGWCDVAVKVDKIIQSQRPIGIKKCLDCSHMRNDPHRDRSMTKFGKFVSSILDPNTSQCSSSSSTNTKGTHKSLKKSYYRKAKADYPSKTKTPKLMKNSNTLGSRPFVQGRKMILSVLPLD